MNHSHAYNQPCTLKCPASVDARSVFVSMTVPVEKDGKTVYSLEPVPLSQLMTGIMSAFSEQANRLEILEEKLRKQEEKKDRAIDEKIELDEISHQGDDTRSSE